MDHLIFVVICGILAFASSTESSSWQVSQPTGKMVKHFLKLHIEKPLPYSSIVYFFHNGTIFCLGVLISPKYVLSDGSCGEPIITVVQVTDAPKTKVLFGDVDVEEDKCISRLVQKVNYEKEGTPLQNYDGFLVAVLAKQIKLSPHISLAYLPKEDIKLNNKNALLVSIRQNRKLKFKNLLISDASGPNLIATLLVTDRLFIENIMPGSPVFCGHNIIGMNGFFPSIKTYTMTYLKNTQLSHDFICKFAPCGKVFISCRNDPGHSSTVGESSSRA